MQRRADRKVSIDASSVLFPGAEIGLDLITKLVRHIYDTAKAARSNKIANGHLASHVKEVYESLDVVDKRLDKEMWIKTKGHLYQVLRDCSTFLTKYNDKPKFIQTILSIHYRNQFDAFHQQLTDQKNRLLFHLIVYIFGHTNAMKNSTNKAMVLNGNKQSGQRYIAPLPYK